MPRALQSCIPSPSDVMKRSRTARKVKATVYSTTSLSSTSGLATGVSTNAGSGTSIKRAGALRVEADEARRKRQRGLEGMC